MHCENDEFDEMLMSLTSKPGLIGVSPLPDKYLTEFVVSAACRTGSREICGTLTTDDDRLVLLNMHLQEGVSLLEACGWFTPFRPGLDTSTSNFEDPKKRFVSMRHPDNDINLILTDSPEFYQTMELATKVATKLKLTSKSDRAMVFDAIMFQQFTPNKYGSK